jgi:hypothetical protein
MHTRNRLFLLKTQSRNLSRRNQAGSADDRPKEPSTVLSVVGASFTRDARILDQYARKVEDKLAGVEQATWWAGCEEECVRFVDSVLGLGRRRQHSFMCRSPTASLMKSGPPGT